MPTQLLSLGPAFTMKQNVVYALPAVRCVLFVVTESFMLEVSNSVAFTDPFAVAPNGGYLKTDSSFIRSTIGDCTVQLTRA